MYLHLFLLLLVSLPTAAVCQAGEVMCADGSGCARVCNGIPECPGSADEVNCRMYISNLNQIKQFYNNTWNLSILCKTLWTA